MKFTRDDKDEDHENHPLECRVCLFCFTAGSRCPYTCTTCQHSHKLGLTHTAKYDISAVRLTKCVRIHNDQHVKAEEEHVPTFLQKWRMIHMKKSSSTQMVTHCVKKMREFHVQLACVPHKTCHCPPLNVIMKRFNCQSKIRDLFSANEAFSLQIGE